MKRTWLTAAVAAFLMLTLPARAQWAVFDATNFAQNLLTAVHTMEQINNQVLQLQNEAQMLSNEGRNLASLNFNSLAQLQATQASTDQLLQAAQGLAFNVTQLNADYARLYPNAYSAGTSNGQMAADAQARWQNSVDALHSAMQLQAQAVQNFPADESTLYSLVGQSQSAVGQLQATQATNQLLALQSRQAMQEQQLRISQDRAAAAELARSAAAQARSIELRRRFLGDGAQYTPQTVDFYTH